MAIERGELQHMALHHIPQRAGGFVERGPLLYAQAFGGGDLHVVDVVAIPQRLEYAVAKAQTRRFCTVSFPR